MSKLSIQEVNTAIMFGDWTNDQINSMVAAVKYARSQLGQKAKFALAVGDTVQFSGRNGYTYNGMVTKIMKKNCLVRTQNTVYRVPANMLEKAA